MVYPTDLMLVWVKAKSQSKELWIDQFFQIQYSQLCQYPVKLSADRVVFSGSSNLVTLVSIENI